MRSYFIGRLVIHALVLVSTLCELGVCANLVAFSSQFALSFAWAQLALAVSVITLVVLIPVLVLDRMRRNALTSWTAIELGWNGVLWILWLAAACYSSDLLEGQDCSYDSFFVIDVDYVMHSPYDDGLSLCQQALAVVSLAWLNWLLLFALFVWLLVCGIIYHPHTSGSIWTSSLSDYQSVGAFGRIKAAAAGGDAPMGQTAYSGTTTAVGSPQSAYKEV